MKLNTADVSKLQYSLLASVLMIIIAAACVYFSFNSTKTADADRRVAQAGRNEFDGKLKRVRNEESEIKQKSAVFNTLQKRGIIGEEQRLEWVELLKDIRDQRRLIDLQYEFAPQRPLDTEPSNGFTFFASTMRVQLKLLHEEDLTRFLDDLRQQAQALIQIKRCTVARQLRGGAESTLSAQLQAECLIDWVTLHEASGKK